MVLSSLSASLLPSLSAICLLFLSLHCFRIEKSLIAPATAFSLTWTCALFALNFTPLIGFYPLGSKATLLYLFGTILFSTTSIFTHYLYNNRKQSYRKNPIQNRKINFKKLFIFYNLTSLVIFPLLALEMLKYGNNLQEISYNIRRLSIHSNLDISPLITNYILFGYFCSILFIYAVFKNKLNRISVFTSLIPLLCGSLILSGRSGIVSLVLAWFFVAVFIDKLDIYKFLKTLLSLIAILFLGAVLVNKFNINGLSFTETTIVFTKHIAGYLFQGPVLFSRYFEGEILVRENWDTLNSVCHILSKVDLCEPFPQHCDFAYYGEWLSGNVYSFYFSIIPHYSYLGCCIFIMLYSFLITVFYEKAKRGELYFLLLSAQLFSGIILSIFKDGFGSQFYLLIKFSFFYVLLIIFFSKTYRLTTKPNHTYHACFTKN